MPSAEVENLRTSLNNLTTVFDARFLRFEDQRKADTESADVRHAENSVLLRQLTDGLVQLQRLLSAIVGEPGTGIDGRLGTMQRDIKDTETRLNQKITDSEQRLQTQVTEAKTAVSDLAEKFSGLGWKLLLLAMGLIGSLVLQILSMVKK